MCYKMYWLKTKGLRRTMYLLIRFARLLPVMFVISLVGCSNNDSYSRTEGVAMWGYPACVGVTLPHQVVQRL